MLLKEKMKLLLALLLKNYHNDVYNSMTSLSKFNFLTLHFDMPIFSILSFLFEYN